MSCWFLLVVFLLLQVVFLLVLVKVRVFDSPVSGQASLRFSEIICWVVVPEPFDLVFHRYVFVFLLYLDCIQALLCYIGPSKFTGKVSWCIIVWVNRDSMRKHGGGILSKNVEKLGRI
jgi:hypothetical protein